MIISFILIGQSCSFFTSTFHLSSLLLLIHIASISSSLTLLPIRFIFSSSLITLFSSVSISLKGEGELGKFNVSTHARPGSEVTRTLHHMLPNVLPQPVTGFISGAPSLVLWFINNNMYTCQPQRTPRVCCKAVI